MARIGHIALLTKDTEKLAGFYKTSFGLNEVARSGEGGENGQAIYLSDVELHCTSPFSIAKSTSPPPG